MDMDIHMASLRDPLPRMGGMEALGMMIRTRICTASHHNLLLRCTMTVVHMLDITPVPHQAANMRTCLTRLQMRVWQARLLCIVKDPLTLVPTQPHTTNSTSNTYSSNINVIAMHKPNNI